MAINKRKTTTAVVASVAAAALLLGGTFAWNSISQQAKNESAGIVNVGGRLHDDFNGTNKDVYVENFTDPLKGGQPIYARIRLDEYMEVGPEAGLTDENGFVDGRNAASVVTTADINDPTTWTPHKPSTDCALCTGGETCLIHDHWTWDMAGQKTFMPTFNKDKDSLDADINGTYAGTDATDNIHYDDYVTYITTGGADVDVIAGTVNGTAVTIPAGTTANALTQANTDVTTVTNVALYDDDSDNVPGNNPPRQETETHTAKDTADGKVITMSEWINTYDKAPGNYWVYDTDGWAYWANPIMPGEATGLLLDSIEMTKNPGEKCYYAINVVGQFATAGDWDPFTTDGGSAPSANAMELLTNAVANVPVVTVTADGNVTTAAPGDVVQFNAGVTIGTTAALANGDFDWSVIDENGDPAASSIDTDGKLTVNAGDVGKTLTVVARSKTHNGAVGISAIAIADSIATTDDMAATAYVLLTENGDTVQVDDGTGTGNTVAAPAYTLSFIRSNTKVAAGDKYKGAEIKEVYVDVESKTHAGFESLPWYGYRAQITAANFDNDVKPFSTAGWFANMGNLTSIDKIENLDTSETTNMAYMFYSCTGLTSIDLSTFNTGKVNNMGAMFSNCVNLTTITGIETWNTSSVTEMSSMFSSCQQLVSPSDLTGWTTDKVTNMSNMFFYCHALEELDLTGWNTSNVTNMEGMFLNSLNLETIDGIGGWNVGSVTNMHGMFQGCSDLLSLDLSAWDTKNVTDMCNMFYSAVDLGNPIMSLTSVGDLGNWDTSKVTNMTHMFEGCGNITSLNFVGTDGEAWDTSSVTDMSCMFTDCTNLKTITGIGDLDTSNVTTMEYMFRETGIEKIDLSGWDTKNVTNMHDLFQTCSNLTEVDLTGWDTSKVTTMTGMFYNCRNLSTIKGNLGDWDVSNVQNFHATFRETALTTLDLSKWKIGKATTLHYMFAGSTQLTSVGDLSSWDTSNVTNMNCAFSNCPALTSVGDISKWDTSKVTNMGWMFNGCTGFTDTLDLSGWDVTNVTEYTSFAANATGITAPNFPATTAE